MPLQISLWPERSKGIAAMVVAGVLWSSGGLLIKWLPIDAYTFCCYRSAFSALLFGIYFRDSIHKVNLCTLLGGAAYAGLMLSFVSATQITTAANAIFLQYTAPAYILVVEALLQKRRMKRTDTITVVACLGGMSLFFVDNLGAGKLAGDLLGLVSGLCLAAFMLIQRFNATDYQPGALFWGNIMLIIVCLPWAWRTGPLEPLHLGMLAYLGLFQIGVAYLFFTFSLRRLSALDVSLLGMLEPILNPIWVWLGYGEAPGAWALAGSAVILSVLAWRSLRRA